MMMLVNVKLDVKEDKFMFHGCRLDWPNSFLMTQLDKLGKIGIKRSLWKPLIHFQNIHYYSPSSGCASTEKLREL